MFLKRIEIDNYKSLKGVVVEPTPLAALVGPNAAGKTNFCEALDFLAHVYQWGLEEAVAYKGGYENICFRDSKEPIRFRVVLELVVPLTGMVLTMSGKLYMEIKYLADHTFVFGRRDESSSAFAVISEDLTVSQTEKESIRMILSLSRWQGLVKVQDETAVDTQLFFKERLKRAAANERKLIYSALRGVLDWSDSLDRGMEAVRVFQINSRESRSSGVPTPSPNLERFGTNLPAVVLHLKKEHPDRYMQILASLRNVLPGVEELEVNFTHTRTLALFVRQRGQLWPAEDLSDGTIQAIATLTAICDPRTPLLILEEPENNVHPWALRGFAEAFREASKTKQIILTTHSPILLDQLKPEEIWIVQKPGSVTKIDPLLTLDPSLKESWEHGHFTLSEYLDSGALPEAVPAAAP